MSGAPTAARAENPGCRPNVNVRLQPMFEKGMWCHTHEQPFRACQEITRLLSEVERLVAALNREHDDVAGYRELLKLPLSPKETCPTCALVDEARRTIGGEDGA